MSEAPSPSRHTNETNSVTGAEAGNSAVPERELPTPAERVEEFREEYGDRARLRLTEQPGQRLRASLTEEAWTEVHVEPQVPSDDATTVHELEKRVPLTWEEAVEQLLKWHEEVRETMLRLEYGHEGHPEHDVFHVPAETSWMLDYQKRYFAELKGWFRETIGGSRPSGGECAGTFENPHVAMLARTASAVPDGRRLPPVDHGEAIDNAWGSFYDTMRNRMRSLGFDSDEWQYYRKEEPHTSERGGGANTCYTHEHIVVIVDGAVTEEDFRPLLEKHVEECEYAGADAHHVGEAVEVLPADQIEDVAAYVASYTGIQPTDLLDRSIEYIAWAVTQWAVNGKQRSRSDAAGWAATADACKQRYESPKSDQEVTHGEEIVPSSRRGVEYECAECGSPWGIEQDHETLTSARLSAGDSGTEAVADGGVEVPDREQELRDRWPSADGAAAVGITPSDLEKREQIEAYLNRNPDASLAEVLGACDLGPPDRDLVREVLAGVDRADAVGFEREPEWHLDAVIVEDEEYPADAGGDVDMAETVMPVERLLNETRLRYVGDVQSPTILVHGVDGDAGYVASHDARQQARRLVSMGLTEPWAAELHLEFQRRHSEHHLAECFEEPEREPPPELQRE